MIKLTELFRKIPHYIVVGFLTLAVMLGYHFFVYGFLYNQKHTVFLENIHFNQTVILFTLFFSFSVLLILYIRRFILRFTTHLFKTILMVLAYCIIILVVQYFIFVFYLSILYLGLYYFCVSALFLIGLLLFIYLCTDEPLREIFYQYKLEIANITIFTFITNLLVCAGVFETDYHSYSIMGFSSDFLTKENSVFEYIIIFSICFIIYRIWYNSQKEEKKIDYRAIFIVYLFMLFFIFIIAHDILLLISFFCFSPIYFISKKNDSKARTKIIILMILNLVIFTSLIVITIILNLQMDNNAIIGLVASVMAQVIAYVLLLIWFVKSKKIKLYFDN